MSIASEHTSLVATDCSCAQTQLEPDPDYKGNSFAHLLHSVFEMSSVDCQGRGFVSSPALGTAAFLLAMFALGGEAG